MAGTCYQGLEAGRRYRAAPAPMVTEMDSVLFTTLDDQCESPPYRLRALDRCPFCFYSAGGARRMLAAPHEADMSSTLRSSCQFRLIARAALSKAWP